MRHLRERAVLSSSSSSSSSSGFARAFNEGAHTGGLGGGVETRNMRRASYAPTAAAPLCNNNAHTRTFADDIEDVFALGIMGNVFDDLDVGRLSPRNDSNDASRDDDRALCRVCREDALSKHVTTQLPSSRTITMVHHRPVKEKKKFCTSCKNYLNATTCFMENRKTCTACLKKHKLYERRRRKRRRNDSKA